MATIKVVRPGYPYGVAPEQQRSGGRITLIRGRYNILVDTGLPPDRESLVEMLAAKGLAPADKCKSLRRGSRRRLCVSGEGWGGRPAPTQIE